MPEPETESPPDGVRADAGTPVSASAKNSLGRRVERFAVHRDVPLATIIASVLVVVVTGFVILLLWVLRQEVLYLVVGSFLALLLSPAVRFLKRRGLSHGTSASLVFVGGVLAFGFVIYLFTAPLVSAVTHFAHELPSLAHQLEHGKGTLGRLVKRLHLQAWVSRNAPKLGSEITKIFKPAQALSAGAAAVSTLVAVTTIAILAFFILLESQNIRRGLVGLLSPRRAERVAHIYDEVSHSVTGYMLGDISTSLIAGAVVLVTLLILGVPFPFLLALWVGLVDLLPLVGGLLAGVPTVVIALIHTPSAGIVTAVVFLVYQQIENHILNPVIMSRTVRLNPLWVLLAVLVGAKLGSQVGSGLGTFVGALIGIPVGGAIQILIREIRQPAGTQPPSEAELVLEASEAELGLEDGVL